MARLKSVKVEFPASRGTNRDAQNGKRDALVFITKEEPKTAQAKFKEPPEARALAAAVAGHTYIGAWGNVPGAPEYLRVDAAADTLIAAYALALRDKTNRPGNGTDTERWVIARDRLKRAVVTGLNNGAI